MTLKKELQSMAHPQLAASYKKFFQAETREGYGWGDRFYGIRVPPLRKLSKKHWTLPRKQVLELLQSPMHEARSLSLMIQSIQYKRSTDEQTRILIYRDYIDNFQHVNNWDLVDMSAPHISGPHLFGGSRAPLHRWSRSKHLWTRRIAVVSNWHLISHNELNEIFPIAERLLEDPHDLIHKAVGWMLREAGKKDLDRLEIFLKKHCHVMPRTMLRYSIEKFPEKKRKIYLQRRV